MKNELQQLINVIVNQLQLIADQSQWNQYRIFPGVVSLFTIIQYEQMLLNNCSGSIEIFSS